MQCKKAHITPLLKMTSHLTQNKIQTPHQCRKRSPHYGFWIFAGYCSLCWNNLPVMVSQPGDHILIFKTVVETS